MTMRRRVAKTDDGVETDGIDAWFDDRGNVRRGMECQVLIQKRRGPGPDGGRSLSLTTAHGGVEGTSDVF